MTCVGFALSWRILEWRLGWCRPMLTEDAQAGPVDGDWWLCMGPVALMFEDDR